MRITKKAAGVFAVGGLGALGLAYILTRKKAEAALDNGTFQFNVTDSETYQPIQGATISISGIAEKQVATDASGVATVALEPGTYGIEIAKTGYQLVDFMRHALPGVTLDINVELAPEGTAPPPPPPPPTPEEQIAAILDTEYAIPRYYGFEPPCWELGTDMWRYWLKLRMGAYRVNAAKPDIDPELAAVYTAVADAIELVRKESFCLYAQYLADLAIEHNVITRTGVNIIEQAQAETCPVTVPDVPILT